MIFIYLSNNVGAMEMCSAEVTVNRRTGVEGTHRMYEISVQNTGLCTIETLFGSLEVPESAQLVHKWNYEFADQEILGFGRNLSVGTTFNGAGFIVTGYGVPYVSSVNPKCSVTCSFPALAAIGFAGMWPISIV